MSAARGAMRGFFCWEFKFRGLFLTAGVVVAAATVMGFLGRLNWVLDLFAHFRVQYAATLAGLALVFAIRREWRHAAWLLAFALVNAAVIVPLYVPPGQADRVARGGPTVRAMLMNVNTSNPKIDLVIRTIQAYQPDFVVLEELDMRWVAALGPLADTYGYLEVQPRDDNFGIGLISKHPFVRSRILDLGEAGLPSVLAEIDFGTNRLTLCGTHPPPPAGRAYSRWRNTHLDQLGQLLAPVRRGVLLLGDLNVTPWSSHFRDLLKVTGLRNSQRGYGLQPTWPTSGPLFLIPIDHALHSGDIRIVNREIGPWIGSDHYPLIVDLELGTPEKVQP